MQELECAFDIELIKRQVQHSQILGEIQEYVVISTGFDKLRNLRYLLTVRLISSSYIEELVDNREVDYEVFNLDNLDDSTDKFWCVSIIDLSTKYIFEDIETIEGIHNEIETLNSRIDAFIDVLLVDNTCIKIQNYSPSFILLNEELIY
jgi:hypothetical protein